MAERHWTRAVLPTSLGMSLCAFVPSLNITASIFSEIFSILGFILGFHMTSRPPYWCPKQRKGGHVGAPTKSSGNLTLLLCKRFLLFSLKNMAVDHVSENQQLHSFGLFVTSSILKQKLEYLWKERWYSKIEKTILNHFKRSLK